MSHTDSADMLKLKCVISPINPTRALPYMVSLVRCGIIRSTADGKSVRNAGLEPVITVAVLFGDASGAVITRFTFNTGDPDLNTAVKNKNNSCASSNTAARVTFSPQGLSGDKHTPARRQPCIKNQLKQPP